jgi:very-short-patch-repair endonuclease
MSDQAIRKLKKDVIAFLEASSSRIAAIEAERFSTSTYCDLIDRGIESPIEDLFYIACRCQCIAEEVSFNPSPEHNGTEWTLGYGIHVMPQFRIDKYRVDFLITQKGIGPSEILSPVVVELDGHEFHDKNKQQRSYEKARDRFLLRAGYRVVHYTGSDVVSDPYSVAYDALSLLGLASINYREYDPKDPLGTGD